MEVDHQTPSEPLLSSPSAENSSSSSSSAPPPTEQGGAVRGGGSSEGSGIPSVAGASSRSSSRMAAGGAGGGGAATIAGGAAAGRVSPSEDSRWECNVCLDQVNEPVVTLCGHLYCWPCLYRWLNSNHNICPVCKAGVSKENVIPLYGRGTEQVDPRTKPRSHDDVPGRPPAQRPEARPQAQVPPGFMGGIPVMNAFGGNQFGNGMSFSAGFGFFPSLFGLQFQTFASNMPPPTGPNNHHVSPDEAQQAFLSRILLMLGIFVIMCLLMF